MKRFETEINAFFGISSSFLLSSGKAALTIALKGLRDLYPDRDEVLIPAYTCYSVPSAIVSAGLKPRLCDLDSGTLDFDYIKIEQKLANKRLLCVIPSHLFGKTADIHRLKALVGEFNIPILEDAAQALGGQYGEEKLGVLGDVGIFSLGRGKAFTTVEGGIIVTRRNDLARKIEKQYLKLPLYDFSDCIKLAASAAALMCLLRPELFWIPKILPFLKMGETNFDPEFKIKRMSSLQAGLGRRWQLRLESFKNERHRISREWSRLMQTLRQQYFSSENNGFSDFIRFPWKVESLTVQKKLLDKSEHLGLGIMKTYPDSIDRIPELACEFVGEEYPVATELAAKILTLPVHPLMKQRDIEKISRIISGIIKGEAENENVS